MSTMMRSARLVTRARPFSTISPLRKSATETAKDTLKAADRTVSDTLVKGINAGGTS